MVFLLPPWLVYFHLFADFSFSVSGTWSGVSLYFPPQVLGQLMALNPFSFLVVPTFCLERSLSSELWTCVFTCHCNWHLHVNVSHLLTQQVPPSHPILSRLFVFLMEVNCLSVHPAVKVVKLPHSFNHQLLSFSTSFRFHPNATTLVSAMLTHLHLLFCLFVFLIFIHKYLFYFIV